jgi:hypothetical protein
VVLVAALKVPLARHRVPNSRREKLLQRDL